MVLFTSSSADTATSMKRDRLAVEITAELLRLRHTLTVLNHNHKGFAYFESFREFLTTTTEKYLQVFGESKLKIVDLATRSVKSREKCLELSLNVFKSQFVFSQNNEKTQNEPRLPRNCILKDHPDSNMAEEGSFTIAQEHSHTKNDILPAYSLHSPTNGILPAYPSPRDPQ